MFKAFLITWLMVREQIIYQRIQAGITQTAGSVRLCSPEYGMVIVV
jgi:hypothetical protein